LAAASATFLSERINRQYTGARPLAVTVIIASADSIFSVDCIGEIQRYEGLFSSVLAFPCSDTNADLKDKDPIFDKLKQFYLDRKQHCNEAVEPTSIDDFIRTQCLCGLDEMVSISSNSLHFTHFSTL